MLTNIHRTLLTARTCDLLGITRPALRQLARTRQAVEALAPWSAIRAAYLADTATVRLGPATGAWMV